MGQQNVLPVREQTEGIFDKVQTARFIDLICTEEVDDDGVLAFVGNFRQGMQFEVVNQIMKLSVVRPDLSSCNDFISLLLVFFKNLLCLNL